MSRTAAEFALILIFGCSLPHVLAQSRPANASEQRRVLPPESRVDINHASLDELLRIPGLARPWAERIVRFRPYRGKNDLIEEGVLPGDVYNRIKDYIIAHRDKR